MKFAFPSRREFPDRSLETIQTGHGSSEESSLLIEVLGIHWFGWRGGLNAAAS